MIVFSGHFVESNRGLSLVSNTDRLNIVLVQVALFTTLLKTRNNIVPNLLGVMFYPSWFGRDLFVFPIGDIHHFKVVSNYQYSA